MTAANDSYQQAVIGSLNAQVSALTAYLASVKNADSTVYGPTGDASSHALAQAQIPVLQAQLTALLDLQAAYTSILAI